MANNWLWICCPGHSSIYYAVQIPGTAIALYYMLCTVGTATCMGTAITLYHLICTVDTTTCVGTANRLPSLCTVHYAVWILSHAWVLLSLYTVSYMQCGYHQHVLPLLYIFMLPMVYNCMLCTQCYRAPANTAIVLYIVCLYCYFIGSSLIMLPHAQSCRHYIIRIILYYMLQVLSKV